MPTHLPAKRIWSEHERDVLQQYSFARQNRSLVLLEGFHALKHAIRFGAKIESALTSDHDLMLRLLGELAPDVRSVMVKLTEEVDPELFRAVSSNATIHTKILAIARRPPGPSDEFLTAASATGPVVLLEDPRNLGNLGAVVRVAAAADARGVVTTGISDPWDTAALRGSAGLHFAVPVWHLDSLPEHNSALIALDPSGDDITGLSLPQNGIFAFGTEREGLSDELLRHATLKVSIPMRVGVSSLNLATSVAVVLFYLRLSSS